MERKFVVSSSFDGPTLHRLQNIAKASNRPVASVIRLIVKSFLANMDDVRVLLAPGSGSNLEDFVKEAP